MFFFKDDRTEAEKARLRAVKALFDAHRRQRDALLWAMIVTGMPG